MSLTERSPDVLAIDPGLDGAIVRIDKDGKIVKVDLMPVFESVKTTGSKKSKKREVDIRGLAKILQKHVDVSHAYLEKVGSMPKQGIASAFKFGRYYGACEMGLAAINLPYTLTTPQSWMKIMHLGISKEYEPKTRSAMALSRSFPDVELKDYASTKKAREGICDAFLLAQYGRKQILG